MLKRHLCLAAVVAAAGVAALSAVGSASAAGDSNFSWSLNAPGLDDGSCGQTLNIGSDATASKSATPSFVMGGEVLGTFSMFIDGAPIGVFTSDALGKVCIRDTIPLSDGTHTLTGVEIAPHSINLVPFSFSVDTVPPSAPGVPSLVITTDTGIAGDNITNLRTSFQLSGTSTTGQGTTSLRVWSGALYLGSAVPDAQGNWLAGCSLYNDGTFTLNAVTYDQANNQSANSPGFNITIDTAPPSATITNPTANAILSGTVPLTINASDNINVWKVAWRVDGVVKTTITSFPPYTYNWPSTSTYNGTHTISAVVTDIAGNVTTTPNVTVNVFNNPEQVPSPPTITAATPGNKLVSLTWSPPASQGASAITGYTLYRGTASGAETVYAIMGNQTSFQDSSVVNGQVYYYYLSAKNTQG